MPLDVQGTFVSQKISRIRWIPDNYDETKCFLTGSWDDDQNLIKVWSLESQEDDNVECPVILSNFIVEGDVTELKFTNTTTIAVSLSNGDVKLLQISAYDKETPLKELYSWKSLHSFGDDQCSCTAIDTIEGDIASVGEDGNVNILSGRRGIITRTISGADSCSLHSVCFIKHNEIITGNQRGHMKIWDLRSEEDKPAASFLLAGDELAATCIVNHPTVNHIVLAGSESGALAIWDVRMNSFPTSLLNAHAAGVTEMQFLPGNSQRMLSCSLSGEIWDWNMESMIKAPSGSDNQVATLLPLEEKNTMMVNSLMPTLHKPINSLHCDRSRVLCGADNEAVYLIKNLKCNLYVDS